MTDPILQKRALRTVSECAHIAAMTEEPGRITRRYLTPPFHDVHALLRARMEALGMTVQVDAVGNMRGLWQPHAGAKRLVIGSHIDTVPNAGPDDGVLGVVLALEWAELAIEQKLPMAIEVIAFSEEEGVRFNVPFIGSRAVAGRFDTSLLALTDASGISLEAAIRNYGLDPARIPEAALDSDAIAFVELHIEQGPVLEAENLSVAAVTSIVGQSRFIVQFIGHANHAGTTPMHLRSDALAGAAEWIGAVEQYAQNMEGLVATVGKIEVDPNAGNVIPGVARVSFEVRHASDAVRTEAANKLLEKAYAIVARRNLAIHCTRQMDQASVPMDEKLTSYLVESMESLGLPAYRMPSGAGHDAMVMAARVPTTMLFLRSPGGISHHPDEAVREVDVENSIAVGRGFLARLAADLI